MGDARACLTPDCEPIKPVEAVHAVTVWANTRRGPAVRKMSGGAENCLSANGRIGYPDTDN
jgi:hypothetical protein